jgi:hypothetical protein
MSVVRFVFVWSLWENPLLPQAIKCTLESAEVLKLGKKILATLTKQKYMTRR